jgi:hypothetical protein
MGRIELDEFVNFKSVEYAYARSLKERERLRLVTQSC